MTTFRAARRLAVLAACLAVATGTALAGCSSGSSSTAGTPPASPGPVTSAGSASGHPASASPFGTPPDLSSLAYAALVECAIHRGLIPNPVLNAEHNFAQWYRNGQVIINGPLGQWWVQEKATVVKGKTLEEWEASIGQTQAMPAEVCGSTAMPSPVPTS